MSTAVSSELFARVGDLDLCYQSFGDPTGEPLLLVMGLGGPMTWWDPDLCQRLAERGFHVVRYDNRDSGRSSRVGRRVSRQEIVRSAARGAFVHRPATGRLRPPYTLQDMADDAFGLMDHLGWDSAHVVGVSMGGMIVQTMAVSRPARVRSLTSIMSTSGRRSVGWQHPRLLPSLLVNRTGGREEYVAGSARMWQLIGSPGYPVEPDEVRARAEETYDRGVSASGVLRQMLAILHQPDRTQAMRELSTPALVIHGLNDPMVHVSGGRATANALRNAELLLVPGMGHDLPRPLYDEIVAAIRRTADRAPRD